jgi:hypothetical protein
MSTLNSSWETWHPKTRQDEEEILREMEGVLTSLEFCNSKRRPAWLRYVVLSTLSGHSYLLKEQTLVRHLPRQLGSDEAATDLCPHHDSQVVSAADSLIAVACTA